MADQRLRKQIPKEKQAETERERERERERGGVGWRNDCMRGDERDNEQVDEGGVI